MYQSLAAGGTWECGGTPLAVDVRLSRTDLLANVVAYVPLGILGGVVLGAWTSGARRRMAFGALAAVAIAGLSLTMEVLQACQSARVSSVWDWLANSAGGLAGLAAWLLAGQGARTLASSAWAPTRAGRGDLGVWLLACAVPLVWLLSQTKPWVFAVDVGTLRSNLSFVRVLAEPAPVDIDLWHVARHFGAWAAIGCSWRLATSRGVTAGALWVGTACVSLGLQVLLDTPSPLSFEELGGMAVAGVALLAAIGVERRAHAHGQTPQSRTRAWARALFWAGVVSVAAYQLRPGSGGPEAADFSWWPRVGLRGLGGALDYALLFGWCGLTVVAASRSAAQAGVRRAPPTWAVSVVLIMLGTEVAQLAIPGRGPDVSAPLFTLLSLLGVTALVGGRHPDEGREPPAPPRPGLRA